MNETTTSFTEASLAYGFSGNTVTQALFDVIRLLVSSIVFEIIIDMNPRSGLI